MALTTEVYLCKNTRLYPGSEDTYYFATEAARQAFFIGKSSNALHVTALSYQRENRSMRLALPVSTVDQCDYLMFRNTAYENKWYYAFITDFSYINDTCTEITFVIDDLQTWLSSCTVATSFIERETTSDDNYGKYTLDEGLSPGELYPYSKTDLSGGSAYLVFAVNRFIYPGLPSDATHKILGSNMREAAYHYETGHSFFGSGDGATHYMIEPAFDWQAYGYGTVPYFYIAFPATATFSKLQEFLDMYTSGIVQDNDNVPLLTPENIVGVFMALDPVFKWNGNAASQPNLTNGYPVIAAGKNCFYDQSAAYGLDFALVNPGTSGHTPAATIVAPTAADGSAMFNGYIPRNKKCLQFPFIQITVDDRNGGNPGMLKPEYFGNKAEYPTTDDNTIYISQYAFINGARCERAMTITHYNKAPLYSQIYDLPPLPTFTFQASNFAIWQQTQGQFLAEQQRVNMERAGLNMTLGTISTLMTGNVLGAASNLVSGVAGMGAQGLANEVSMKQATASAGQQPPLSRGAMSGVGIMAMQASNNALWPCAIKYCSRKEAVQAADIYLEQYGYKVMRRGTPAYAGRTRFYYIRGNISFSNTTGVPANAQKNILNRFSGGIRFWKGDYLGDYSVANTIAT